MFSFLIIRLSFKWNKLNLFSNAKYHNIIDEAKLLKHITKNTNATWENKYEVHISPK